MKIIFILLLCTSAFAGFNRQGDEIQPFKDPNYPLSSLIEDYASLTGTSVSYADDLFRKDETVHVNFNSSQSPKEFEKFFYSSLDMAGFTAISENGVLWIYNSRDIRYLPVEVYTDDSYPVDKTYSTVIIKLKNPLSSKISRNLRPIMSRYGRVIDFSDGYTLLINDLGTNIDRLKKTIASMDTEKAWKTLLEAEPKQKEPENPLREKVLDLQIENDILKKKCVNSGEVRS